ncbi:hypothetical protein DIPPA_70013 [Diplonema papillatum]|nr:hypothetical protein DIPPA_70013 [Diplonema papillatum]
MEGRDDLFRRDALLDARVGDLVDSLAICREWETAEVNVFPDSVSLPEYDVDLANMPHPALYWNPSSLNHARYFNEAFQKAASTPIGKRGDLELAETWKKRVATDFAAFVLNHLHEVLSLAEEREVGCTTSKRTCVEGLIVSQYGNNEAVQPYESFRRGLTLDLQAARAVVAVNPVDLHIPLACIVQARGAAFRVDCDLGFDAGNVVSEDSQIKCALNLLAENLGVRVQGFGQQLLVNCSPIDGRVYITQLTALFPKSLWTTFQQAKRDLDTVNAETMALWIDKNRSQVSLDEEVFRPEYMWTLFGPLSADAFSSWKNDDNRSEEVLQSTTHLYLRGISELAEKWSTQKLNVNSENLCTFLHASGVGFRCLGYFAEALVAQGETGWPLDVVRVEMACRCLKAVVKKKIRNRETPPWYMQSHDLQGAIVMDVLMRFLGVGLTRLDGTDDLLWDTEIAPLLTDKFGAKPFKRQDLQHIKISRDAINLLDSLTPSLPTRGKEEFERMKDGFDPLVLRRRACVLLRLKLYRDATSPLGIGCFVADRVKSIIPEAYPPPQEAIRYSRPQDCTTRIAQFRRRSLKTAPLSTSEQLLRCLPFHNALITMSLFNKDPAAAQQLRKTIELRSQNRDGLNNSLQIMRESISLAHIIRRENVRESDALLKNAVECAEDEFGQRSGPFVEAITAQASCLLGAADRSENFLISASQTFARAYEACRAVGAHVGTLLSDYADLLAQVGDAEKADELYLVALKVVKREQSESSAEFVRLLWRLGILRKNTDLLTSLLPLLQRVLPQSGAVFCREVVVYGKLAVEQDKVKPAADFHLQWLQHVLAQVPPTLRPSQWNDECLRPALTALVFVENVVHLIGQRAALELQEQVLRIMQQTTGLENAFAVHAVRPLGRLHLAAAKSCPTASGRTEELFRAGAYLKQELRLLLTIAEDIDIKTVVSIMSAPGGDAHLPMIRKRAVSVDGSNTREALHILKRCVARVLTEEIADPMEALLVPYEKKKLLLSFWEEIELAENTPVRPLDCYTRLQLADRLDTWSALCELSKVWGSPEQSRYYNTKYRSGKYEVEALADVSRRKRGLAAFLKDITQFGLWWTDSAPGTSQTEPTGVVNSEPTTEYKGANTAQPGAGVNLSSNRVFPATDAARRANPSCWQPCSVKSPPRQAMASVPFLRLTLRKSLLRPGETVDVSWCFDDGHRREFSYLAIVPQHFGGSVAASALSRYTGYKVHQPKGSIKTSFFSAPAIPGDYVVVFMPDLLTSMPPSHDHTAQFCVAIPGRQPHGKAENGEIAKKKTLVHSPPHPTSPLPALRHTAHKSSTDMSLHKYQNMHTFFEEAGKVQIVDIRSKDTKWLKNV